MRRLAGEGEGASRDTHTLTEIGPGLRSRRSRGGNSTQLLGAIKMSRNSEIIIHTPSAVGSQETQDMGGRRG